MFVHVSKEDASIIFQKTAVAINVQLTLFGGEEEGIDKILFVPLNEFNGALNEDKVLLCGSGGQG